MSKYKYRFGITYNGWQGFANEANYWRARIAFICGMSVADFQKEMDKL